MKKTWDAVPELDSLVQRVRARGQLVSYTRPPGSRRGASLSASARQYRAMVASQGGGDSPLTGRPQLAARPFAQPSPALPGMPLAGNAAAIARR